jgi:D-glycero-D-manno-heptose 1,7-bisphosphate phosphatase
MRARFAMLDRDGTLIRERHYLSEPRGVELLPGAAAGLRELRAKGLGLVILTNQSGVGRGYLDESKLARIHDRLRDLLREEGVELDGIYHCPHVPEDQCHCRKPETGLAERAAAELGFDLGRSIMVGDKVIDMQMGKAVGATTFLVLTGYGREERDKALEFTDHVLGDLSGIAGYVE